MFYVFHELRSLREDTTLKPLFLNNFLMLLNKRTKKYYLYSSNLSLVIQINELNFSCFVLLKKIDTSYANVASFPYIYE